MKANLPKRLIEVDLPIRRISYYARKEKYISTISSLHQWWAPRPLAACRSVLCAMLWPDPADDSCPELFIEKAKKEMLSWCSFERLEKLSTDSYSRFNEARKDFSLFDELEELRLALLDFIADFSDWNNAQDAEYLETAKRLTQCAHEALGGIPGSNPLVVDSFAGGGAIPLEGLRVGGDAFASDLNPIPVLLNKVILDYTPKYGEELAAEVLKWGEWVKEKAESELSKYYVSDEDGLIPIAYIWARTIISEDPGQSDLPIEIPLMRSLWLSKKKNDLKALRWKRNKQGEIECEKVEVIYANGKKAKVRRPLFEIFSPASSQEVDNGTVANGSATCPVTGFTTPVASVRNQMKERYGGANDARMVCVVSKKQRIRGRYYRLPTELDINSNEIARKDLELLIEKHNGPYPLVPHEMTPRGGGSGAGRAFSQRNYGMEKFSDLYTPRQLVAMITLVRLIREVSEKIKTIKNAGFSEAVVVCLTLACGRESDYLNSLCAWNPSGPKIQHMYGRQAIPIVWDFAEAGLLSDSVGSWQSMLKNVLNGLSSANCGSQSLNQVLRASADAHPLPDDIAQCYFSDPPYYDAVPYSDLSDFFYVWFKRILGDQLPDLFSDELAPKEDECIVDEVKNKDNEYFELMMRNSMAEGRRILSSEGIGCVVFAHKSTGGWEAQLQAMVDAGWTITASWPIDTEMGSRLRAMNSAALASSVHLVVRPRVVNGNGGVGDWRDILDELPKRIGIWLPRLAEEGVVGADAIFACLGPALEIFSRYDSVEKASGDIVTLREYLEQVWAAVSREALSSVVADADLSSFEADARLSAMWLWTVAAGSRENGDADDGSKILKPIGFELEYDAARKIAQGLGADLGNLKSVVEVQGDKATLLSVAQRTQYLFGKNETEPVGGKKKRKTTQLSLFETLLEDEGSENYWETKTAEKPGETVLDRVHQAMILFASGRGQALKRFLVTEGVGQEAGLWKLAQALSALYPVGTQEKRWVDGLLARKKGLGL